MQYVLVAVSKDTLCDLIYFVDLMSVFCEYKIKN